MRWQMLSAKFYLIHSMKLGDNAYKIVEELNPDKVNGEWRKYLSHIAHDKN